MSKRPLADFEIHQAKAYDALERRKKAERDILEAALDFVHNPGSLEAVEGLEQTVFRYNQADADFRDAQDAINDRGRAR